jgi:methylamine dehydrogenase accessory protein MauD
MIAALIASNIVLWLLVLLLAGMVLLLLRQVGLLHERLGPVGALTLPGGPQAGAVAPSFDLVALDGRPVRLGRESAAGRSTLVFFLSPTCPICKRLLPVVKSMAASDRLKTDVILASDGDEDAQRAMIERHGLQDIPFVLSTDLGRAYGVSKLPYAVLLAPDGRIAAKGLVNNREHLDSLFEARDRGVASLQDYLKGRHLAVVPDKAEKMGAAQ